MINSNYHSNKKGIYKDLYRAISAEQNKKTAPAPYRARKGIYKDLYRQLEEDKNSLNFGMTQNKQENITKSIYKKILSKIAYLPLLIYTIWMVIKKSGTSKRLLIEGKQIFTDFRKSLNFQKFKNNFLQPSIGVFTINYATRPIDNLSEKSLNSGYTGNSKVTDGR